MNLYILFLSTVILNLILFFFCGAIIIFNLIILFNFVVDVSLKDYINKYLKPQSLKDLGNGKILRNILIKKYSLYCINLTFMLSYKLVYFVKYKKKIICFNLCWLKRVKYTTYNGQSLLASFLMIIFKLSMYHFPETFYWFGDNNFTEWQSLFDLYQPPPYTLPDHVGAYSFGMAGVWLGLFSVFSMCVTW